MAETLPFLRGTAGYKRLNKENAIKYKYKNVYHILIRTARYKDVRKKMLLNTLNASNKNMLIVFKIRTNTPFFSRGLLCISI